MTALPFCKPSPNCSHMKALVSFLVLLFFVSTSWAQIPEPTNPVRQEASQKQPSYIKSATYKKTGDDTYTLYSESGIALNQMQDLTKLSTSSLATLHLPSRTIILLTDFDDVAVGSTNPTKILLRDTAKDFYLTNPNSFITYVDDKSYTVEVTRVKDSYVAYVAELDKTYIEKDIRLFPDWGAANLIDMGYAPDNTYWYRDVATKEYAIIIRGESMDYTDVTSELRGDDRIVLKNGKPVYLLKDYVNASTYVVRPVSTKVGAYGSEGGGSVSSDSNCVRGDCEDGFGKYEYNNGYYDGFWRNGKKSGYGLYSWDDGATYIGNWENDNMDGYGVFTDNNDDMYKGMFKNDALQGKAVKNIGDDWERGIYDEGRLTQEFDFYGTDETEGCTVGDCQDKYGKMVFDNGDTFVGFFKNGNLQMGTYSFASGASYSGQFDSSGRFSGMGRFWFANGDYYGGAWSKGKFNGRGYYSVKDSGDIKIGYFEDGNFVRSE